MQISLGPQLISNVRLRDFDTEYAEDKKNARQQNQLGGVYKIQNCNRYIQPFFKLTAQNMSEMGFFFLKNTARVTNNI